MKFRFVFAIFVSLVLAVPALATPKIYGGAVVEEVTSIYDRDTFRCNIAGYPNIIGERIAIRINGIDTPEMRDNRPPVTALARKAKEYTVQRLREGRHIVLRNMKRGKYFRIVADVYVDGRSLAGEVISQGMTKSYNGGIKPKWER